MGVTPAELSELQELKAVRDGLDAQIGSLRASNSATALGLPARCGRLRPLTQLWLASRIDHSPGTMAHVNRDRELFARAATLRAERRTRVAGGEDDELVCAEQKAKLYEEQLALDTQALETTERVNARWSNRLNPFYTPRQPQTAPNLAAILFRDVFAQDFDERFLSFLAARASVPAEFSVANIGIQLCITRIIVPRLANLAWNNPATTVKLVLYLAGAILEGIMPAAT
jgi:hypothetical protein